MHYDVPENRNGKRWGLAWAAAYLGLWVLLMFLIKFPIQDIARADEGIMINFGDAEAAGGEQDTRLTDDQAPTASQPQPDTRPTPHTPSPNGDVAVPNPERPRPTPRTQPTEQPRQADPRALFPGRTQGSTSTSEGTSTGAGNQGNPAGSPDGSHAGTGTGTSGTSFNLSGRSVAGALPKPDYNSRKEGKVVVEITVNASGAVTNAVYRASGSVGVDNVMIEDALRAARKARFNPVESENLQTGTITYVFKMN